MIGNPSIIAVGLQLLFLISAFAADEYTITDKAKINCTAVTSETSMDPCYAMLTQLTISPKLPVMNLTAIPKGLAVRDVMVRVFEGLLLTNDTELTGEDFMKFCKSFEALYHCATLTKTLCASKLNGAVVVQEYFSILGSLMMTDKGDRMACNPESGVPAITFMKYLDSMSIKACLNSIPMERKQEMMKVIREVGNTLVDRTIILTNPDKAGREARAICRKLDDVIMTFKLAVRCNPEECNSTTIGLFGSIVLNLLSTPGVCGCGKNVLQDESSDATGRPFAKYRTTVNFIGLSHLNNSKFGNNYETCIMESGEVALLISDDLAISATMVYVNKGSNRIFSFMRKITIQLFGDKKNCKGTGDTPAKTIVFGKGAPSVTNSTSKCGTKEIKVNTLYSSQRSSSRIQIIDQCNGVAMIVRSQRIPALGEVLYLTMRLSESVELAGFLYSGCVKQVQVSGVSATNSRRKKRSATSTFAAIGEYDYKKSGDKEMRAAAEATADDIRDVEKTDSEALDETVTLPTTAGPGTSPTSDVTKPGTTPKQCPTTGSESAYMVNALAVVTVATMMALALNA